MKKPADWNKCDCYVSLYESEMQQIAANSALWGNLETGGDLFGLLTHGSRVVVLLALPPGPNATHEAAHFAQDIDHHRRTSALIGQHFGLQLMGTHHSHHRLGLDEPSGGDVRQVQSITDKNNITHWLDIITTHQDGPLTYERPGGDPLAKSCRRPGQWFAEAPDVRLNAFFYTDAPTGQKVRCAIKVLPGLSPVRQALIGSGLLTPAELGHDGWLFPMAKVLFDAAASDSSGTATTQEIPEELTRQVLQLPADLRKTITIIPKGSLFVIFLPLRERFEVQIPFHSESLSPIQAVYLAEADQDRPRDITEKIGSDGLHISLAQIYARVCSLLDNASGSAEGAADAPVAPTQQRRFVQIIKSFSRTRLPSESGRRSVGE